MIGAFFKRLATVVVGLLALTAVTTADVPSLAPGDSWEHTYTCTGFTYTGGAPSPMTISTDVNSKQWWVQFGDSVQYANATGAWTLQGGQWWNIPGVNYQNQALYQHGTRDVSQDPCYIKNFGLIYDVTSCSCLLASEVILYNDTDPLCRRHDREGSFVNNDPQNRHGVYFLEWRFSQLFNYPGVGTINAGGDFAAGDPSAHHASRSCTLDFTPPPFGKVDPASIFPVPYCALFNPISCSPPRPVA